MAIPAIAPPLNFELADDAAEALPEAGPELEVADALEVLALVAELDELEAGLDFSNMLWENTAWISGDVHEAGWDPLAAMPAATISGVT
jgi:hypothetical protein